MSQAERSTQHAWLALAAALVAVTGLGDPAAGQPSQAAPAVRSAALGPALAERLQRPLPSEGLSVAVALTDADLGPPGSARRAAVARRQQRVLDSLPAGSFRLTHRYRSLSGFAGRAQRGAVEALLRHSEAALVYLDGRVHASLAQGKQLIGATTVHSQGYTGAGVKVAVLDTGIDSDHPDLQNDIAAQHCFCSLGFPMGGCCAGGATEAATAEDDEGHGTSVAGIVSSDGLQAATGVAPAAGLVAVKVLDSAGDGSFADVAAALDWVLSERAVPGGPVEGVRVVNLSLNDDVEYNNPNAAPCSGSNTANGIAQLVQAGVTVVVSSGNDGFDDGLAFPACVPEAISVGGVYDAALGNANWGICTDAATAADDFVCHSNSDEILDVLAPNWRTSTSALGGGIRNFGGTSASAPYVAGEVALLLEARPPLTPAHVRTLLKANGPTVVNSDNGLGFTRTDVSAATAAALQLILPPAFEEVAFVGAGNDTTSLTLATPAGTAGDDLLIAVVTLDGAHAGSLAPPGGGGWTQLALDDGSGNATTLGVWWKLAEPSESPTHPFTWSGSEEAVGYIMRFTGHELAGPIDAVATQGGVSASPTAPGITTNFEGALILRIGGFDDDDATVGDAGMSGHTTVVMDESGRGNRSCSSGAAFALRGGSSTVSPASFTLAASEEWRTVTLAIVPEQPPVQTCGDGQVVGTEQCDDGAGNGSTACGCAADCTFPGAGSACSDGVACTDNDVCDGAGACTPGAANDANCDNGQFCDGAETCDVVSDCQAGPPPVIDDGVACTDDSCDEAGDAVVNAPNDANCDNGQFCDGAESCDVVSDCQAGPPPVLDDGVACTDDSCDEAGDAVVNAPNDANCDNGQFCDGAESCDVVSDCQAGPPPVLDDGVACTDDSCDEAGDAVVNAPNDANCDNGQFCDGAESCDVVSDCQAGPPPVLDDGVACTDDSCDEAGDQIVHLPDDLVCDDGDLCTADSCDGILGCTNEAILGCSTGVPASSGSGRAFLAALVLAAGALLLRRLALSASANEWAA